MTEVIARILLVGFIILTARLAVFGMRVAIGAICLFCVGVLVGRWIR